MLLFSVFPVLHIMEKRSCFFLVCFFYTIANFSPLTKKHSYEFSVGYYIDLCQYKGDMCANAKENIIENSNICQKQRGRALSVYTPRGGAEVASCKVRRCQVVGEAGERL